MKTRLLMAAVIALSGIATVGTTFADSPSGEPTAISTKTRAEVKAELEQARSEGLLMNSGEHGFRDEWSGSKTGAMGVAGSRYSSRTREEVRAEAIDHLKTHKLGFDDMYGR